MSKKVIAFAGKGGVGKTSSLVLLLKYLIENKKNTNILVIDSDPDANLSDVIGKKISFCDTIGGKMSKLKDQIQKMKLPPDASKNQIIESEVFNCLIEMDKYDLLVMSRSEGEGCYCFVNSVLKNTIDTLSKNYEITLLDSPAGLEHFARKTGRNVTDMVLVTDPSKMGFHTMQRILEITKEVSLKFENIWILGNRFPDNLKEILLDQVKEIKQENVHLLGFIPNDDEISKFNLTGKSLLELNSNNPSYLKAKEIYSKIV